MSDADLTNQVPGELRLVIKDKVNLEFLLNQVMSQDLTDMVLDMVQSEIDTHLNKLAKYFQEQKNNAVIDVARVSAEQFIQTLEIDGTPISIYDARPGKGSYPGKIIYTNGEYAVQKISAESVILHQLSRLDNEVKAGQLLQIRYQDGLGSVNGWMPAIQKATDTKADRQETPLSLIDNKPKGVVNSDSLKLARRNPKAYEAARSFILDLDADAKISEIRLEKGNYKGPILESPALSDGYFVQQIGDKSFIIHDSADITVPGPSVQYGAEHKYRFIYKDGEGRIEVVDLAADVKKMASNGAASASVVEEQKAAMVSQKPSSIPMEPVRRDPVAYEAAKAFILNSYADPKISEIRLDKSSYKGSVLESPKQSDGYLVQQIGDKSFIIHDSADITVPGPSVQYGAEHKYRFIYKDGEGRIEEVERVESKEATGANNRPSMTLINSNPVSPAKPIASALYNEARQHAERLLGEQAAIYTARVSDTPEEKSTKGEFIFVNFRYAVQRIGTKTALVHDCERMQSVNPKTINGPVAISYKDGKANVTELPPEWWKEKQRHAVNKAFGGRTNAVQQNTRPVSETAEPEVGGR